MEAIATAQAVPQVSEKLSNTDSLAVVLSQALQAGDKALLDRCLGVSNERVIRNTVSKLQSSQAVVLLEAATQRLQSSPQRGKEVSAWLRAVLLAHTASIMASSGAKQILSGLSDLIEERLATRDSLLQLQGRLDLLFAQIAGRQATGTAGLPQPLLKYDERDEQLEVQDVLKAGDADNSDLSEEDMEEVDSGRSSEEDSEDDSEADGED